MSLPDALAEQLGAVRVQQARLAEIAQHLVAAIDVAFDLEKITSSSTAAPAVSTLPSPPGAVAVDTAAHHGTQGRSVGSKYDLEQVASLARQAIASGVAVSKHVHANIPECPSPAMAAFLITSAREAGHDIPKTRKNTPRPKPASPAPTAKESQVTGRVFACSSCDHEAVQVRDIIRHTRSVHDRDAFASERMPT